MDKSKMLVSNGLGSESKLLSSRKILDNDSIPMSASLSNKLQNTNPSGVHWNSGNFEQNGGKSMTMDEISNHFSRVKS
jgi:hypothetical protein